MLRSRLKSNAKRELRLPFCTGPESDLPDDCLSTACHCAYQAKTRQHHGVGLGFRYSGDHDGAIREAIRVLYVYVGGIGIELVEIKTRGFGPYGGQGSPA